MIKLLKISDVVTALNQIKEEYGDLELFYNQRHTLIGITEVGVFADMLNSKAVLNHFITSGKLERQRGMIVIRSTADCDMEV
jgi:hypothetical protein